MLNSEIYPTDQQFRFKPVTCSVIRRIIMAMPRNKSPGPDKVSMGVIKDCLPVILGPLTNLINSFLMLGKFSDKSDKTIWSNTSFTFRGFIKGLWKSCTRPI